MSSNKETKLNLVEIIFILSFLALRTFDNSDLKEKLKKYRALNLKEKSAKSVVQNWQNRLYF